MMMITMIPVVMTASFMNEADALLIIKESLNNPISLDSWKPGTSPCDETSKWFGLVCGNGIVTTLRLKSLNLSGELDLFGLSQLPGLRVINIVNNSFSGPIPEFNKLGALKAIYMSMNQFSGEIPSSFFSNMVSLKKVWFDNNNFSGPIPSSLAQLPRLLELHLNNNNFSGLIPLIGQKTLQSLDLSNNNLTGDIPSSLSRFDVALFDGNPGLCGPKLRKLCVNVKHNHKGPKPPSKPPPESLKTAYMLMGLSGSILVAMIIAIYMLVQKRKKEEADQMCLEKRNGDGSYGLGIISSGSPKEKEDDSTRQSLDKGSPKKTKGSGDLISSVGCKASSMVYKGTRTLKQPPQLLVYHMKQQEELHRGFLAIGTFGNNDLPTPENIMNDATATSSPDLSEFTPEEIGKLQKELTNLLSKKPAAGETNADLPLDRFLNCPSSLEVDRRLSTAVITNPDDKEEIDRTIKVILGRCKDISMENTSNKKAIRKKSISFLLKKMFVCSSGLPPMPGLHDRLPESRMERLLRAMLKNKMNPQNSSRASSAKKLIGNRQSSKKGKGKATEKDDEDANDGSKWVKTDSECKFIVN
ncbi:hypothetical protein M8C21_000568 [Ambrosia artemisiifolia]|uniref:Leucine-rich repeat-containing N-terminal plant-type domain-containing protein n=1 Tax=Ambrosia artemisiifolia TaxID=4212 RepID=A0AAD5GCX5_AMBAR|nr:hypothetical protein M8C21_000568 [Ambrosia artemisiifolia]